MAGLMSQAQQALPLLSALNAQAGSMQAALGSLPGVVTRLEALEVSWRQELAGLQGHMAALHAEQARLAARLAALEAGGAAGAAAACEDGQGRVGSTAASS